MAAAREGLGLTGRGDWKGTPAAMGHSITRRGSRGELGGLVAASEIAMENQGRRNGVRAHGGGGRGRLHDYPELESPGLGDPTGDGHGRSVHNGEERNGAAKEVVAVGDAEEGTMTTLRALTQEAQIAGRKLGPRTRVNRPAAEET